MKMPKVLNTSKELLITFVALFLIAGTVKMYSCSSDMDVDSEQTTRESESAPDAE